MALKNKLFSFCLCFVLAFSLCLSPYCLAVESGHPVVRKQQAHAVAPLAGAAAAAAAWGCEESAVTAALVALCAACGISMAASTQTGYDWDAMAQADYMLYENGMLNSAGPDPDFDPNNGDGDDNTKSFLQTVKDLAIFGAVNAAGSALYGACTSVMDYFLPVSSVDDSQGAPIDTTYMFDYSFRNLNLKFGNPVGYPYDSSFCSWNFLSNYIPFQYRVLPSDYPVLKIALNPSTVYYPRGTRLVSYLNPNTLESDRITTSAGISDPQQYVYSYGARIEIYESYSFSNGSFSNLVGGYESGTWFGDFNVSNPTPNYVPENAPENLLSVLNNGALGAYTSNGVNARSDIVGVTAEAVLEYLRNLYSNTVIQVTPSTTPAFQDVVTNEPKVEPVTPSIPGTSDPDTPVKPLPSQPQIKDRFESIVNLAFGSIFPFCLVDDLRLLWVKLASAGEPDFTLHVPLSDFGIAGAEDLFIDASDLETLGGYVRIFFDILFVSALLALSFRLFLNRGGE